MARELGERMVLGSPCGGSSSSHGGVRVVSDRAVVNAKRVIVAMPPTLAGRIDYQPGLPARATS